MGIPDAAVTLFQSLETVQEGSRPDVDEAIRRTWVTDLVIALSAFPSLPPSATQYRRTELKRLLPSADQLEPRPGIQQAMSKIERIFTKGQRMPLTPWIASSH
jgi:hypothetical protein